jgi:PKD repeat protein
MVAVDGLTSSFDGSSSLTTGDATFAWDFGDGSTGSGPAPSHTYAAAGTYTVRLTVVDGGGDDTTQQDVTATVPNEPPVAGFVLGAVGPAAMLDASSSADPDGRVVSFRWDFGDGTVGTGVAPLHLFPGPGSYDVVLTVTDDDGASDTHLYTFRYRV